MLYVTQSFCQWQWNKTVTNLAEGIMSEATNWFMPNGLLLNDSKTQSLTTSLKNMDKNIEIDIGHKTFWGIFIDKEFNCVPHIH